MYETRHQPKSLTDTSLHEPVHLNGSATMALSHHEPTLSHHPYQAISAYQLVETA